MPEPGRWLAAVGLEDRAADPCANLGHGPAPAAGNRHHLPSPQTPSFCYWTSRWLVLAESDRVVVGALIRKLAESHAVLLIEHDIDRVLASCPDRITVLHQGRLIADGNPAEVASNPDVVTAYLGSERIIPPPAPTDADRAAHAASKPVLVVNKLRAGYAGSVVLEDLSLIVHEGEAVALLGRNGVGKTTTLRAITGTVRSASGHITLDGGDITNGKPYEINQKGISLVPEGRRLFPNLTVVDNLLLAMRPGGASIDDVYALFPKLKLLQRSKAESLSGGERQMLAIARALVVPAKLILLDEPFEGLAPTIVKEVMDALAQLRGRVAMVIVEHHAETVLPLVDRVYVLVNGQVAYEGSARALEADAALQARLLGLVHAEELAA